MTPALNLTRRTFIAASTAGIASTLVPTRHALGANARVNIGVIGCGAQGTKLLHDLADCSATKVTAVCDIFKPHNDRANALTGAKPYRTWQTLLDRNDIDAVVIATPDHLHAEMAIAALDTGKHVYCEAPMALGLKAARDLRDQAARSGLAVQFGATTLSDGRWHAAKKLIERNTTGTISVVHAAASIPPTQTAVNENNWRSNWEYSDGPVSAPCFGLTAALLYTLGAQFPSQVSAAGGSSTGEMNGGPDRMIVSARFAPECALTLSFVADGITPAPPLVRGETSSIEIHDKTVVVRPEPGGEREVTMRTEQRANLLENWIDAIRGEGTCVCGPELAFRAQTVCSLAFESYRKRKTLHLDAHGELRDRV